MQIMTKEVAGFIPALHGMRSPMNSWHLNDSYIKNEKKSRYISKTLCKLNITCNIKIKD